MSDQERTTLTQPATRALQMRQHVEAIANAIRTDHRADEIFERAISSRRHVHGYSVRNRILQQWQAPMSRLVASLSAFEAIALEQGAEAVTIKGKSRRVMLQVGSRGVWIWGRSRRRQFRDSISDEEQTEVSVSFVPVAWAVEDVIYAVSREPFQLPDHVHAVDDTRLYHGLMEFASSRGIAVEHRGLLGPRGTSHGGRISLQHGDSEAVQLSILAHEVMHELLHHAPESRHLSKTIVEREAEAGAAVLLRHYGHDVPASAAYLRQHGIWPVDVLNSMDRIIRATSEVIEFIEGREG